MGKYLSFTQVEYGASQLFWTWQPCFQTIIPPWIVLVSHILRECSKQYQIYEYKLQVACHSFQLTFGNCIFIYSINREIALYNLKIIFRENMTVESYTVIFSLKSFHNQN